MIVQLHKHAPPSFSNLSRAPVRVADTRDADAELEVTPPTENLREPIPPGPVWHSDRAVTNTGDRPSCASGR
jgi:hypothetical protein